MGRRGPRKEAEGPRRRMGQEMMGEDRDQRRKHSYQRLSGRRGAWTLPAVRCGHLPTPSRGG